MNYSNWLKIVKQKFEHPIMKKDTKLYPGDEYKIDEEIDPYK